MTGIDEDKDLALVEFILYGVAQVKLFPSNERTKVILPPKNNVKVGEIYSISNDHSQLILN
ncbi:hypothetical protein [Limosilactobacillus fastidiosus]|uniref:Uncharacterized protein n=1 Tax=Limosilactobacillus fastidiosus TaxID=2759855 RepID=A0A7W3YBK7_9LACO|nr:hypothetical protein [Limosilactobacillus fastidiosus]MBB1063201.1 hypothetical protein [Limosilactobacillus fastidiosus]MBB1085383.1 hypothetical protein [Limosilactobacillus fastidiosus]MCD7083685.1 hypothetical protein [Limosilactobacillus fastidiosus]MCD7085365.1 hypothetical protein [Limosilactobacillus fastidiosus]MCD7114870.1 hypothetical protein [Limosilactobacillus fastidiosus]